MAMTPDATAIAIARLEERFDALEAGQVKILKAVSDLRAGDTEMQIRITRLEGDLEKRPTYKEVITGIVVCSTLLIAIAELIIQVVLK